MCHDFACKLRLFRTDEQACLKILHSSLAPECRRNTVHQLGRAHAGQHAPFRHDAADGAQHTVKRAGGSHIGAVRFERFAVLHAGIADTALDEHGILFYQNMQLGLRLRYKSDLFKRIENAAQTFHFMAKRRHIRIQKHNYLK